MICFQLLFIFLSELSTSTESIELRTAMIFKTAVDLTSLNEMGLDSLVSHLGIEFVETGQDFLTARMPVDERTRQPFGILHGGASAALAETVGSVAATLCLDLNQQRVVGLEINANHVKPVKTGYVYGTARPVHLGQRTHVWEIKITDEAQKLVCVSRLTLMVMNKHVSDDSSSQQQA
jgi:1,4-dihydroxy-2-naphthoyl-CoA hydrolase